MALIKCKVCGGDIQISENSPFGICKYCGSAMTLPKISDEQRTARYNRGNQFRRDGKFDEALAQYEQLVQEDDTDAEAHWCCALCRFGIDYVEDPETLEYIPTCHRLSFESFLNDVDYQAALANSDGFAYRQYQKEAKRIAEVQKGILTTSQNEEPFDVFICYKESDDNGQRTRDSLLAQDIYYQLMEHGYRTFYSRITLEDKAGTEYEPYIFAALNSAKVMVVVTTSKDHVNAVWVKNEWSRYLSLMRKDRSKLLLPCYRDMDPYDLPEALSVLQSYDMSKIGFIQDLIRGIEKVIKNNSATIANKETQGTAALLKRMFISLEDGEWDNAEKNIERVLDQEPENGEAYLGKLMCELHIRKKEDLNNQRISISNRNSYQRALRYGNESLKDLLQRAGVSTAANEKADKTEATYQSAISAMSKAKQQETEENYKGALAGYRNATALFALIPKYKDVQEKSGECAIAAKNVQKISEHNEQIYAKHRQIETLSKKREQFNIEEKKLNDALANMRRINGQLISQSKTAINAEKKRIEEVASKRSASKTTLIMGIVLSLVGPAYLLWLLSGELNNCGVADGLLALATGPALFLIGIKVLSSGANRYRDSKAIPAPSKESADMHEKELAKRVFEFEKQEQQLENKIAQARAEQTRLESEIKQIQGELLQRGERLVE